MPLDSVALIVAGDTSPDVLELVMRVLRDRDFATQVLGLVNTYGYAPRPTVPIDAIPLDAQPILQILQNADGAWVGVATIADETGLSKQSVGRTLGAGLDKILSRHGVKVRKKMIKGVTSYALHRQV